MTEKNILYSFRRCPYAMRARLAIASSGEQFELREIILRDKPDHMLEVSPKGTVPVAIIADENVVDESLDIALWALDRSDPEGLMHPVLDDTEAMLALIEKQDVSFKPLLDKYKYHFHSDRDAALTARDEAAAFLSELNERLSTSPRLFGDKTTLADISIWPFIRQFAHVDKDWFWSQPYPHLISWLDDFLASDRFAAIMSKYKRWEIGDEPVIFPESQKA